MLPPCYSTLASWCAGSKVVVLIRFLTMLFLLLRFSLLGIGLGKNIPLLL